MSTLNEASPSNLRPEILWPVAFRRQARLMVWAGRPRTGLLWVLDRLGCSATRSRQGDRLVDTVVPPGKLFALAWSLVLLGFRSIEVQARASLCALSPHTGRLR